MSEESRTVKLEVSVIVTREFTKIIEVLESSANKMIGGLYNDGWSEEETVVFTERIMGSITHERISREIDTIDVLYANPPYPEE